MSTEISTAFESGHGDALVYAGALGLLISDIIPTPADSIYFSMMQKNKRKLENKEITPKQYWTRDAVLYYTLNPIWWAIVLAVIYFSGGDYTTKFKVGIAIISAGVVFSVLQKNIEKDVKKI